MASVAGRITQSLQGRGEDEALRWILQFVDDFRGSSPQGRTSLIVDPPQLIGDNRYDAALAALVEHLCAEAALAVPRWTSQPERFAEPWWFVAGIPDYEAAALRDSPISFKRHGVFLTARALQRV